MKAGKTGHCPPNGEIAQENLFSARGIGKTGGCVSVERDA